MFVFFAVREYEGLKMKRSEMLSPTCSELSTVAKLNYAKGMALPRKYFNTNTEPRTCLPVCRLHKYFVADCFVIHRI
jgi:hypothetical protein